MKVIILSLTLISNISLATTKTEQQLNPEIKKIIDKLVPGALNKDGKTHLKTIGCKVQQEKWLMLMLTKEGFTENISFNKTCDFQGVIKVAADKYFPLNLNIRNLSNFKTLNSLFKFSLLFEKEPILQFWMKDAVLLGKEKRQFSLTYRFVIDPTNPENPIKKNLGGSIDIKENNKIKNIKLK